MQQIKMMPSSKLSGMGLMPTQIAAAGGSSPTKASAKKATKGKSKKGGFGKVIKPEDLTVFTRQVATLLEAGLPLLRSLEVMIRQERNLRFKAVLEQIADQVKSGNSFSDGLAQHPKTFDRLFVNMVRAGEAGGVLDVVLSRLAGFMEKALKTKKKVKSAMVYPVVVVGVAVSIVALLMVVVVPKFQTIFDDMLDGAALPGPTQLVIGISNFHAWKYYYDRSSCCSRFLRLQICDENWPRGATLQLGFAQLAQGR